MSSTDAAFSGAVAQFYDRYLATMFRSQSEPLVARLTLERGALLEVAAGTGNVTILLVERLPPDVAITATDLNQPMLDVLATKPGMARVTIQQADALALPFADASFDAVICQFGAMFYPDRVRGHAEARRVLRPGGRYLFNVWDQIDANPVIHIVEQAVAALYPADPPAFFRRTPFGYYDRDRLRADLLAAGFTACTIDPVAAEWVIGSPADAATALCQGTPLRAEIEARDPGGVQRATDAAAQAITARFGDGPSATPTRALLVDCHT